jgi:hypothetical protein
MRSSSLFIVKIGRTGTTSSTDGVEIPFETSGEEAPACCHSFDSSKWVLGSASPPPHEARIGLDARIQDHRTLALPVLGGVCTTNSFSTGTACADSKMLWGSWCRAQVIKRCHMNDKSLIEFKPFPVV